MPHLDAAADAQRRQRRCGAQLSRLLRCQLQCRRLQTASLAQQLRLLSAVAAITAPIVVHHLFSTAVAAQTCWVHAPRAAKSAHGSRSR